MAVTTLPRVTEFLSETFIYECKGWDIWGLPPLEYPGLAKVPHHTSLSIVTTSTL